MSHPTRTVVTFTIMTMIALGIAGCKKQVAVSSDDKLLAEAAQKFSEVTSAVAKTNTTATPLSWGNAPDFTLPLINGGTLTLSSLQGKVIIVNFFATWCPPCRMEIPDFVALQTHYAAQGLAIVGVALDEQQAVVPFAKEMNINYDVVIGDQQVAESYGGIRGIPTTFIIDRTGNIVSKHSGFTDKATFEKEIQAL